MDDLQERLAAIVGGSKWILVDVVSAGLTDLVARFRDYGAEDIMVVAATDGVGPLPENVTVHLSGTTGDTLVGGIRAFFDGLDKPDQTLIDALDVFDPDRAARVVGVHFATLTEIVDRRVYGARRPEWLALEDKMIVDELWDAAGVPRAPAKTVPVADAVAAHEALAGPLGSVWVADNREGWHGGGEYARWVRTDEDVTAALDWFSDHAYQVRVMPFLDGIPCSIHGYVTEARTAAFRPVEMLILRRADASGFFYAGLSTYWDPPAGVRKEMRAGARAVGALLDERVGYRGPFSIDGVCTTDGFLPTELNPRLSAGFARQASVVEDLPLSLVTKAFIEGDLVVDPTWLEDLVLPAADFIRAGGMGAGTPTSHDRTSIRITFRNGDAVVTDEDDDADALIEIGPTPSGSYVRMNIDPGRVEPGPSMAPRAIAAIDLVRELWDLDIPPVVAAPDLC